jgi:uncharacterized ion transporter superfamily protein YfcC
MPMKKIPNTYIIIFAIVVVCAFATWLVPGGEYVKNEPSQTIIEQGSINSEQSTVIFKSVPSVRQSWQVLSAFYNGFVKQAGIICFILVIGASFWVVNKSRAVDAGIFSFLSALTKLERNSFFAKVGVNNIVITLVMVMFSLFGAVFGMSEETIAFVVIVIPLAISMGYDSIVGICMVYVAAHVGFAGAILNPFTIGIAQDIAGLPLFSGIEYRFFCWVVLTIVSIIFVLAYASKIKKNPKKSIMYEADEHWRAQMRSDGGKLEYYKNRSSFVAFIIASIVIILFTIFYSANCMVSIGGGKFAAPYLLPIIAIGFIVSSICALRKSVHFFVLNLLSFTIIYLIVGVLAYSWYIGEISALFLALGVLSGVAIGLSGDNIIKELLNGAKDILSAALVVGLAAGIVFILQEGHIIDTILHSMSSGLSDAGEVGSLEIMYAIQTFINVFIPSASAKAAITMPIMAPFSDMIGVSRQATILAFQFGDGFTNMITPTSGVLIAVLGIARIPYGKWFKWVLPFVLMLIIAGALLLLPTIFMHLPGF